MTQAAKLPAWMEQRIAGTTAAPSQIELAPDEAEPFALFCSLGTQWRRCAMTGIRLGLDNVAIPPTAAMMDIAMTPAILHDLRVMEDAALAAFAEARR